SRERDDRTRRPVRISKAGDHVRYPRAILAVHIAGSPARPGIPVSGVYRGVLAPTQDHLDAGVIKRDPQGVVTAGETEEVFGPVRLEGLAHGVSNGRHRWLPSGRISTLAAEASPLPYRESSGVRVRPAAHTSSRPQLTSGKSDHLWTEKYKECTW